MQLIVQPSFLGSETFYSHVLSVFYFCRIMNVAVLGFYVLNYISSYKANLNRYKNGFSRILGSWAILNWLKLGEDCQFSFF